MSLDRVSHNKHSPLWELFVRYELAFAILAMALVLIPGMWSYSLIDPWETHYGEVARRMLQDSDWIHLHWQDESFRSKPILTFWLMGLGMKLFGVASSGGFSGELSNSEVVMLAVRLPFTVFAIIGLSTMFWMLRSLVNRRVAWLSVLILASTPIYSMVARQAITDMPMVACVIGALSCFAMSLARQDKPMPTYFGRITSLDIFLGLFSALVLWQLIYLAVYFNMHPRVAQGVPIKSPALTMCIPMALGLIALIAWCVRLRLQNRFYQHQVYMLYFYAFVAISVLAKGPPGLGLVGAVCLFYLLISGEWHLLRRIEFWRGVVIVVLLTVPWHLAMWIKDGAPWANEYFNHHMFKRFGKGVHGDRGTFDYFASQIGVGMWPWSGFLPVALAGSLLWKATGKTQAAGDEHSQRTRLLVGIWSVVGVGLFVASQTKFHHYILPAIPALAISIAFWLDGCLRSLGQRSFGLTLPAAVAACIVALVAHDFVNEPKQLIELFIYRYDRPWPAGDPWNVDLSGVFLAFAGLSLVTLVLSSLRHTAMIGVWAFVAVALSFGIWLNNGYMSAAAPHWGQRELHRSYMELREIHGLDIKYFGLRSVAEEWSSPQDIHVDSALPDGFATGLAMTITLHVPNADLQGDQISVSGSVSRVGDNEFWISVSQQERSKLSALVERGRTMPSIKRQPWRQVNADRLIAWQLNWRGENFWSGGEIFGEIPDTRTVFMKTDNKAFLEYIKAPERQGRRFYVVTESGRARGLKNILPSKRAKESFELVDTSCNKFTLLRFDL